LKAGLVIHRLKLTLGEHGAANTPLENAVIENAAAAVTPNTANFARIIHSSNISAFSKMFYLLSLGNLNAILVPAVWMAVSLSISAAPID
jgi:hypothetical protein